VGSELKHRSPLGSSSDPVSDAVVDAAAPFAKASRPRDRVPTEAWVRKHESSVGPRSIAAVVPMMGLKFQSGELVGASSHRCSTDGIIQA